MDRHLLRGVLLACGLCGIAQPAWATIDAGLLYRQDEEPTTRQVDTQAAGPLLFLNRRPSHVEWGIRPLVSFVRDDATAHAEFDLLYPLLTDRSSPAGHDGQLLQLIRWSSTPHADGQRTIDLMLTPLLIYRSGRPGLPGDLVIFPLYGSLHHVLWNDRIGFVLFPLWLSLERDQITRHFILWPFFDWATAASENAPPAHGWRFWPFYGELTQEGVKEERFVLWPLFIHQRLDLNSAAPHEQLMLLPFYSATRSPDERSTSWLWPLFRHAINTKTHYEEWALPWPLIQFGSGDERHLRRIFPFYSEESRTTHIDLLGTTQQIHSTSKIILWPFYHSTSEIGPDGRRDRDRLLLFLYSDLRVRKANAPTDARRIDLWPFFTYNKTADGAVTFQTLAPIEPFLNTAAITRNYSPLWSLATYSRRQDGVSDFTLLWGLVHSRTTPQTVDRSLLLGLIRWTTTEHDRQLRLFYLPSIRWERAATPPPPASSEQDHDPSR